MQQDSGFIIFLSSIKSNSTPLIFEFEEVLNIVGIEIIKLSFIDRNFKDEANVDKELIVSIPNVALSFNEDGIQTPYLDKISAKKSFLTSSPFIYEVEHKKYSHLSFHSNFIKITFDGSGVRINEFAPLYLKIKFLYNKE